MAPQPSVLPDARHAPRLLAAFPNPHPMHSTASILVRALMGSHRHPWHHTPSNLLTVLSVALHYEHGAATPASLDLTGLIMEH